MCVCVCVCVCVGGSPWVCVGGWVGVHTTYIISEFIKYHFVSLKFACHLQAVETKKNCKYNQE